MTIAMRSVTHRRTTLGLVAMAALVLLVAGCAKQPKEEELGRSGGGFEEGRLGDRDRLEGERIQDETTRSLQTQLSAVYFDYDRATLRDDARSRLQEAADAIRGFPSWAEITIEGHCDERGTEEYNLALGDRRANVVKKYLVALGVSPGRIATVSYGELKPAVRGHDETAWRWNRRAEFQVSR